MATLQLNYVILSILILVAVILFSLWIITLVIKYSYYLNGSEYFKIMKSILEDYAEQHDIEI